MPVKKFVLIMAGGTGTRMNHSVPKQFAQLLGKPILMHTFRVFYEFDPGINFILVLPETEIDQWKKLCQKHNFPIKHKIAFGGETRFQSVKNGLEKITEDGIVFIHDGVRPLVSKKTITNCLETTITKGNALPVFQVTESLRKVENNLNQAVERSKYFLVQTPQTFWVNEIKNAYKQGFSEKFTDDASVLENMGKTINLVEGNRENIKITYPSDLTIATSIMEHSGK